VATRFSAADVERVAALARLDLTDREMELFVPQLAAILAYAEQIQALDTTGVPPTAHAFAPAHGWRDDEPAPSLPREEALTNAPDAARDAGLFRVPRVLGG
jgi:aspartyl-tRNA(Asn)/glutamyl-tRNA(Gln) amidotransferase subunit C